MIVDVLEESKAEDIVLLDIREITVIADYFVICSGTSDRMLQFLADEVTKKMKRTFHLQVKMEGLPQDGWMLVDYGTVVLHIFSTDQRDYYRLDELWTDGKVLVHLQ